MGSLLIIFIAGISLTECRKPVRSLETSPPAEHDQPSNKVASPPLSWKTIQGKKIDYEKGREFLQDLMKEHGVTALSIAISDRVDGDMLINLGNRDSSGKPITHKTVFQAGRISQPIFAWLMMKLDDEGIFDIDRPVVEYLKNSLSGYPGYKGLERDPRCRKLTGRLILCHQSGFPISKNGDQGQSIQFIRTPGERFGFSDAAYRLLQLAVEESTGKKINELAKEKVFLRHSMANTSFVREPRFEDDIAVGRDHHSDSIITDDQNNADVAASLYTTSEDLLKFLWNMTYPTAEMSMENRSSYSSKMVVIDTESINSDVKAQKGIKGLGWSQGWGKYNPRGLYMTFHGGRDYGYENFVSRYTLMRYNGLKAIVILSVTSENSTTFMGRILDELIGDTFSPLEWMGFK